MTLVLVNQFVKRLLTFRNRASYI